MTERVKCRDEGCERTILPSTAAETGGLCMPCVAAKKRREHAAWVAANAIEVDRFAGITDPVEIACLLVERPPRDELRIDVPYPKPLSRVVAELEAADISRLVAKSTSMLRDSDSTRFESGRTLAESLVLLRTDMSHEDLMSLQSTMLDRDDAYPAYLFRSADKSIVTRLLDAIANPGDEHVGHLLCALAWTEHTDAIAAFRTWCEQAPSFAGSLHLEPARYLHDAGIELRGDRVARLWPTNCCELVPNAHADRPRNQGNPEVGSYDGGSNKDTSNDEAERQAGALRVIVDAEGASCSFCGDPLTLLFDLRLDAPQLAFLDLQWQRLRVPICERCSCFGSIYFDVGRDGSFAWAEENERPEYIAEGEWGAMPRECLDLGAERPATAAVDWIHDTTCSQLGGLPSWVQDFDYPNCPGCKQTMPFLGQVSREDIEEYGEGIYYAFFCVDCSKTSSTYQQT